MNPMFTVNMDSDRIVPDKEYLELQEQIESAIVRKVEIEHGSRSAVDRLSFFTLDRPVTIHPGNAERVMGQLCPDAVITVILMGKNVYRAVYIDTETDIFPAKNCIYLDVSDVRYNQVDHEIDTIVSAIQPFLAAAARSPAPNRTASHAPRGG
jgi:hypothetical protein